MQAERFGAKNPKACPNCRRLKGNKLTKERLTNLAHSFFVRGTVQRFDYGHAPKVVFNEHQPTSISVPPWLKSDIRVLEKLLRVGFFEYGPRYWMLGHITPLEDLIRRRTRASVIERILNTYPIRKFTRKNEFYRVRKAPTNPGRFQEYDSPPKGRLGSGRLDSRSLPVLYGSTDLVLCVHECRLAVEDEVYVATLRPKKTLRLLDLTELLDEPKVTEFESLDHAIHFLFLAGKHAYEITRSIARAVRKAGLDGVIYPSYFSLVRTGFPPLETTYGISHRRIPGLADSERLKVVPNLAVFGRPIFEGAVEVRSVNKLILRQVDYTLTFGPILIEADEASGSFESAGTIADGGAK